MNQAIRPRNTVIAVPADVVEDLERKRIAARLPVFRGAALDAVLTIGTDAGVLVTLLQAPDAVQTFSAWIRDLCHRSDDSLVITARLGGRRVSVRTDRGIDPSIVTDFVAAALAAHPPPPSQAEDGYAGQPERAT